MVIRCGSSLVSLLSAIFFTNKIAITYNTKSWTYSFSVSEYEVIFLQRNYRFFFMFVFSTTLLCIYVFAFCWVYIRRIMEAEDTTIWKAMIKTPASIVLIVYTFISMWFVGGLTAFHLYLIGTNQVRDPYSTCPTV